MSDEDLLKLLIGVTSAFAGWVLAQFTSFAKGWLQRRKIRALLLEELRDLDFEANRILSFYSRELQIYGAKGIGNSSTTGISNYIFKNYYKDALLSLNQQQRISYQMIHSFVDQVNAGILELKEMTIEIQDEHFANGLSEKIAKACGGWGEKLKSEYQHCASLQWQIRFHLQNEKSPDLSLYTNHHENYVRYLQNVKAEADRIIESGKTIDRDKFNQAYNPESFQRAAPL
ncbi:hypothetical protein [Xanthomonas euvesicatoria]|uniref:hypothetical protein n=1 Tax=Xanthomonas euvesicatoria TaxID=456327 RepID=UPI001C494A53|nr:hypothetical protein [Xanthomonas euvesicatoria]MBV6847843.1 hypothetical protein [Xanthomonas campestris pv. heliotropii]